MRQTGLLLCALAALVLASGAAAAADKKGKSVKPAAKAEKPAAAKPAAKAAAAKKGPIPDDIPDVHVSLGDLQGVLTSEVKVADDQKSKLAEKIGASQAVLTKWDKDNAARREAEIAALEKAREGSDSEATDAAMAKVQAFGAEREKLELDQQADVLSVLSAEQKASWEGYKLYTGLLSVYGKFDLDLTQMEKMRTLAAGTAKELADAADEAARADARKKLMNAVQGDVLTQPQKDRIASASPEKGAKPAAGGRKPAGDKKKPAADGKGKAGAKPATGGTTTPPAGDASGGGTATE